MNFSLTKLFFLLVLFVLFFSTNACADDTLKVKHDNENTPDCVLASNGEIVDSGLTRKSKTEIAHLFCCAVSIRVADLNETMAQGKLIVKRKTRLADQLLSLEMDIHYTDYSDSTLLDVVIMSYLPEVWKEKAVKTLLSRGVDSKHVNQFGKDAKFYAMQNGNQKILKLVSSYNKQDGRRMK